MSMDAQDRAINQDKRYALRRNDTYMVHLVSGTRVYNGTDKSEAEAIQAANPGSKLTDLTVASNQLTEAQTLIEALKVTCRRSNQRYLTVNHRNGKKLYSGNDPREARKAVANSSCTMLDLDQEELAVH